MADTMNSRERMLTTINHDVPDRVPLYLRVFGERVPEHMRHKKAFERVQRWYDRGVDDILDMFAPWGHHPDVQVRTWRESPSKGERYPRLCKEYETPAGVLRHIVHETDDDLGDKWPNQQDEVHLMDDFNVPRAVKHAVCGPDDLPKLRYLLSEPSADQLALFRTCMKETREFCQTSGTLLAGWGPCGADGAIWLCGVEPAIFMAVDAPDFFEELLDIIHVYDKRCCELVMEEGVDMIVHRGWYQTTRFWSPDMFDRFIAPNLKRLVDMAHENDTKFAYTMSSGMMPLLDRFKDIGIDLLYHLDPVQGGADLAVVKQKLHGHVAVLGGMNSSVTVGRGDRDEIRNAVFHAVETLGPGGGFILNPVDCLYPDAPPENIEALIEAWREVCQYS